MKRGPEELRSVEQGRRVCFPDSFKEKRFVWFAAGLRVQYKIGRHSLSNSYFL